MTAKHLVNYRIAGIAAAVLLLSACQPADNTDTGVHETQAEPSAHVSQADKTGDASTLFVAHDYLGDGTFTHLIEGPAVGPDGTLYLVGLGDSRNIAKVVTPKNGEPHPVVFVTVPKGSTPNGIRFGLKGNMFVTDYTGHNILRVDMDTDKVTVFAHLPGASQPNDIALAPNGNLYASDPNWDKGTGQLWLIRPDGGVKLLETGMGTTNGIAVSPDGKRLYVDESKQRDIWVYDIRDNGELANKRLFMKFDDYGLDGMRCDVKGNLYIARYGAGLVLVVSPSGEVPHKVRLKGDKPTNVAFGGPEGRTVYVTLQDRGAVEVFRSKYPGRFY